MSIRTKFKRINKLFTKRIALPLALGFFVLGFCLIIPQNANAAFNASNIISDGEFGASRTMNEQEIQDFLVSKGSYLANYSETRNSFIGPSNNISVQGWKASRVIYEVANWYNINPQVILVTLQKEESLITLSNPEQWRIDTAMGYGCPDSAPCGDQYKGFSMQVDWGSWQLIWNMNKANDSNITERNKVAPYYTGNTISIDGVSTYLGNGSTASLYRYTPHFNGNISFYNLYTQWFKPEDYLSSSIRATSHVYIAPYPLVVGGTATAYVDIKNFSSGSITLEGASIGLKHEVTKEYVPFTRTANCTTLASGATCTVEGTFTIPKEGYYYFWVNGKKDNTYFTIKADSNQNASGFIPADPLNLKATSHVFFNPWPLTVGIVNTAYVDLKNFSANEIMLTGASIGLKNTKTGEYMPFNITGSTCLLISAGDTCRLQGTFTPTKEGNYYFWVSGRYGDSYFTVRPSSSENIKGHVPVDPPKIKATSHVFFTPWPLTVGQNNVRVDLKNTSSQNIILSGSYIGLKNIQTGAYMPFNVTSSCTIISAGDICTLRGTITPTSKGTFYFWVTGRIGSYYFTVKSDGNYNVTGLVPTQ